MYGIGNVHASLKLMPDFQKWKIAAMLAMKMASVLGEVVILGVSSTRGN